MFQKFLAFPYLHSIPKKIRYCSKSFLLSGYFGVFNRERLDSFTEAFFSTHSSELQGINYRETQAVFQTPFPLSWIAGYHRAGPNRVPDGSHSRHPGVDGDQRWLHAWDRAHHRQLHPQPQAAGTHRLWWSWELPASLFRYFVALWPSGLLIYGDVQV